MSLNATPKEALLKTILSQPSAPFRESHVIRTILHELKASEVPHFQDPIGNIVIGAASAKEYQALARRKSDDPLRVFIAHMDHPGFHGTRWITPNCLAVKWHGGSPTQHLEGAAVWLADQQGWVAEGHFTEVKMIPSGRAIDTAVVEIPLQDRRTDTRLKAESLFGGLRFRENMWQEGELIYTKAADDLVGAFAITSLAIDLLGKSAAGGGKKKTSARKTAPPFIGLLTRAEEVGFIGAIGHFEKGYLKGAKRPILCVSLETSRTLPGADIGKGPVVRLGDKFTVFDANALRVFSEVAKQALPERHQRRVMDGGTCEGTTAMAYGFPTVGISVPLGNYHNQSFEGGPDSAGPLGPAPEFVHRQDIEGLMELCKALMSPKIKWDNPWRAKVKEFKKDLKDYQPLLRSM